MRTAKWSPKVLLHTPVRRAIIRTKDLANRTGYKNVQLDSFIVSTTSYQDLKPYYGNGDWSEEDFKDKHILFQKRGTEYDYISFILQQ